MSPYIIYQYLNVYFYYNFLFIADANLKVKINVYCSEEINVITKFYNFVLTVNDCYNSGMETFLSRKKRSLAIILIFMSFVKKYLKS